MGDTNCNPPLVPAYNMSHTHSHEGHGHSHDGGFNAQEHGHSHEILDGPGSYIGREMPIVEGRDWSERAFTVGIGGPVGSGKTALMLALCLALRERYSLAAVTNDIFTREDAEFLTRRPPSLPTASRSSRQAAAPMPPSVKISPPTSPPSRTSTKSSAPTCCSSSQAATTWRPTTHASLPTLSSTSLTCRAATRCRAREGPGSRRVIYWW